MLPSMNTVNGCSLFGENEAILIEKFLIIFDEIKRPVKNVEMLKILLIIEATVNCELLPSSLVIVCIVLKVSKSSEILIKTLIARK